MSRHVIFGSFFALFVIFLVIVFMKQKTVAKNALRCKQTIAGRTGWPRLNQRLMDIKREIDWEASRPTQAGELSSSRIIIIIST
jgi:hypothetical protein